MKHKLPEQILHDKHSIIRPYFHKVLKFHFLEKVPSPHSNRHSPHVACGEWVGQR